MDISVISPDLIELQNVEFGVKFQQVVFNGRDRFEYDLIYTKTLLANRRKISSVCVRSRCKDMSSDVHTGNHYEDYEITDSVVLNSNFR